MKIQGNKLRLQWTRICVKFQYSVIVDLDICAWCDKAKPIRKVVHLGMKVSEQVVKWLKSIRRTKQFTQTPHPLVDTCLGTCENFSSNIDIGGRALGQQHLIEINKNMDLAKCLDNNCYTILKAKRGRFKAREMKRRIKWRKFNGELSGLLVKIDFKALNMISTTGHHGKELKTVDCKHNFNSLNWAVFFSCSESDDEAEPSWNLNVLSYHISTPESSMLSRFGT